MAIESIRKSALSLLLCGALLAVSGGMAVSAASQSDVDDLKDKIESLEEDEKEQQKIQEELEARIEETERQIALCTQQIAGLDSEIETKEAEIDQKTAELEDNKELFKQRLRAMYMSGGTNDLEVLLGADDFADYLVKSELSRSISEHDNELMEEIAYTISEVEAEKAEVEAKKAERTAVKKELASQKSSLNDDLAESKALLAQIGEDKDDAQREYDKAVADVEAQIKAASSSDSYDGEISGETGIIVDYTGDGFCWPCPGYYGITSGFKWRWGRQHKGIDISSSGIYGKPIVAADSGTVIVAGYNNGGYGNYVMVDHGNGFITLYGHMSAYAVSSGQRVSQGEVIGYVGNTGRSTGPHLHFEVRVDGTPVDPTQFF